MRSRRGGGDDDDGDIMMMDMRMKAKMVRMVKTTAEMKTKAKVR